MDKNNQRNDPEYTFSNKFCLKKGFMKKKYHTMKLIYIGQPQTLAEANRNLKKKKNSKASKRI